MIFFGVGKVPFMYAFSIRQFIRMYIDDFFLESSLM